MLVTGYEVQPNKNRSLGMELIFRRLHHRWDPTSHLQPNDQFTFFGDEKQTALTTPDDPHGFPLSRLKFPEAGSREIASHVVRNGALTLVLASPLRWPDSPPPPPADAKPVAKTHQRLAAQKGAVKS